LNTTLLCLPFSSNYLDFRGGGWEAESGTCGRFEGKKEREGTDRLPKKKKGKKEIKKKKKQEGGGRVREGVCFVREGK